MIKFLVILFITKLYARTNIFKTKNAIKISNMDANTLVCRYY